MDREDERPISFINMSCKSGTQIVELSVPDRDRIPRRQAKIIITIKGGVCLDVKSNIPDGLWEYAIVDYDNEPDLPDNYVPFSEDEMKPFL